MPAGSSSSGIPALPDTVSNTWISSPFASLFCLFVLLSVLAYAIFLFCRRPKKIIRNVHACRNDIEFDSTQYPEDDTAMRLMKNNAFQVARKFRKQFKRTSFDDIADKATAFGIHRSIVHNERFPVYDKNLMRPTAFTKRFVWACHVPMPEMHPIICAQVPTERTVYAFWSLVLEQKVEMLYFLGNFNEATPGVNRPIFQFAPGVDMHDIGFVNPDNPKETITISQYDYKDMNFMPLTFSEFRVRWKGPAGNCEHTMLFSCWNEWSNDHSINDTVYCDGFILHYLHKKVRCMFVDLTGASRTGALIMRILTRKDIILGHDPEIFEKLQFLRDECLPNAVSTRLQFLSIFVGCLDATSELFDENDMDAFHERLLQRWISDCAEIAAKGFQKHQKLYQKRREMAYLHCRNGL